MGEFVRIHPHGISLRQRWPWCLLCTFPKLKQVDTWNLLQLYDTVLCNSYISRLASLVCFQMLSRGATPNSVLQQHSQSHRCQVGQRVRPGSLRSMPLVCSQATSRSCSWSLWRRFPKDRETEQEFTPGLTKTKLGGENMGLGQLSCPLFKSNTRWSLQTMAAQSIYARLKPEVNRACWHLWL